MTKASSGLPKVTRPRRAPALSQAEVIVLWLVSQRPRHGYDIMRQVEGMRVRMWAKVGAATIYATLDRLERRGSVRTQPDGRSLGPTRRVRAITAKGRAQLVASVRLLLRSRASVYSDRVVGLAMSAALPLRTARREVGATATFLDRTLQAFEAYRHAEGESLASAIVVGFCRDILSAERRACQIVLGRPSGKRRHCLLPSFSRA